ncbi:hypothetical protein ACFT9M_16605 [Micromonospora purpureochromogenes]|uniref:hypothetical protein n=1 Tax=Micromonospora purpureochromogenes TaxID=47872 RepID=UPI003631A736
MPVPGLTAECSLYRTRQQYRVGTTWAPPESGVQPASDCVEDCIADCIAASADSGLPTQLLRAECLPVCRAQCHQGPWPCEPGTKLCFRTGFTPHCCPEDNECCEVLNATRDDYDLQCCPPGQKCCFKYGCYVPGEQQCTDQGFCPPGNPICDGRCCDVGDVCTLDGCTKPELVCNNRRCSPGQTCTPQGCCRSDRVAEGNCCPDGQAISNGKCCAPGWSATSQGCCPPNVCCETVPCPPGRSCCGGKICCPPDRDCRPVADTSEVGCFKRG